MTQLGFAQRTNRPRPWITPAAVVIGVRISPSAGGARPFVLFVLVPAVVAVAILMPSGDPAPILG